MDVGDINPGQRQHRDEVGVRCQKLFQDFLEEYKEDGELKYLEPTLELQNEERNTILISFDDVEKYNQNLATTIIEEYYRIYPFLCQAVFNFLKDRAGLKTEKDCYISFIDVPTKHRVRELKTAKIGTLVRISGQVIRTHPVHPELISGTFTCMDCQTVIKNVEQQFKFTQPKICRNPVCSNRRKFELNIDKSHFVDFQKIRIQETQAELPRGSVPRSVEIILRAENVETVQAGDRFDFTGTLIVVPDVGALGAQIQTRPKSLNRQESDGVKGLKELGVRDLHYRMAFLACSVHQINPKVGGIEMPVGTEITPEIMKQQMSEAEWTHMYEMSHDKNLYENMINSLFPSIHGNDEVKKGILLMLFGGVRKETIEGTSLRGDINCCIVGDPSTAKSHFLKEISEFSPRAVYTSGKASSAAGLTAAAVRDEESSEFVIEAGALMLADNGICCIDEFDKMELRDQVAIHEAMEQQTISIAKAGIRATLNARTSILAAANPVGGKYDRTKSLQHNVNLSAPIMSRFDLFFILVDECNEVVDYAIARKILDMHCNNEENTEQIYSKQDILQYITFAKQFQPVLSKEAGDLLVHFYTKLRLRDNTSYGRAAWRITIRQLESMIRLSEAMAKMDISDEVQPKHVREAYKLLNSSVIRVERPDILLDEGNNDTVIADEEPEPLQTTPGPLQTATKKKMLLTFDEYKAISNKIVVYMRKEESKMESEGKEGVYRRDVVEWYLNHIADEIDNEDELIQKKDMFEKILDRLIYQDNIIIPLTRVGLKGTQGTEDEDENNPMLVVHPNYVLD